MTDCATAPDCGFEGAPRIAVPDSGNAGAVVKEWDGLKRIAITEMVPVEVNSAIPLTPLVEANCVGVAKAAWPCGGSTMEVCVTALPFEFCVATVMVCAVVPVFAIAIEVTKPLVLS